MNELTGRLNLQFPMYVDLPMIQATGQKAAHACWHFYTLAEKKRQQVGDGPESQIILEGNPWLDANYEPIAMSVALLYGLRSPDDWQRFWPVVEAQARDLGYGCPSQEYRGRKRLVIH